MADISKAEAARIRSLLLQARRLTGYASLTDGEKNAVLVYLFNKFGKGKLIDGTGDL